MKKLTILLSAILSFTAAASETTMVPEPIVAAQASSTQDENTYTYVRCWYRTSHSHDDAATDWKWAENADGDDLKIDGYWWSSTSFKNMFYTNTPQNVIKKSCADTLGVDHDNADMTFFAANNRFSYNHSIWTNDVVMQPNKINKVVAFGDSLSDTGNMFNASQWRFPNPNSWFLGHFSNGFVWTEYVANAQNIPLYNWSVGGAAGTNQYVALTGIYEQVTSYLTYMKMANHYNPENILFTLEFGLNDFMNYNREVGDVKADYSSALVRLIDSGAKNLLLMTLPDATKAPQFKYSTKEEVAKVRAKIVALNAFIKEQAAYYLVLGYNVKLYDTYALFEGLTESPEQYGFANASDACLDINRSSAIDYMLSHRLTNDCASNGSDKYVFWGVTHPTTATHKYIADEILDSGLEMFNF